MEGCHYVYWKHGSRPIDYPIRIVVVTIALVGLTTFLWKGLFNGTILTMFLYFFLNRLRYMLYQQALINKANNTFPLTSGKQGQRIDGLVMTHI